MRVVAEIERQLDRLDLQSVHRPHILPGRFGSVARAWRGIGAYRGTAYDRKSAVRPGVTPPLNDTRLPSVPIAVAATAARHG